jgi:hypothetical protein
MMQKAKWKKRVRNILRRADGSMTLSAIHDATGASFPGSLDLVKTILRYGVQVGSVMVEPGDELRYMLAKKP